MQHRNRDDERAVEPVRHIDVVGFALHDGAEEQHRIRHPNNGDQNINRPLQLGVFFGAGHAHRQGDCRQHNNQLPAPEHKPREARRQQRGLTGSLYHKERRPHEGTAPKGKNHRIRMQWPQAAEAEPGRVKVELRPHQLCRNQHTDSHANNAPHHGHHGKLPHDFVVVDWMF